MNGTPTLISPKAMNFLQGFGPGYSFIVMRAKDTEIRAGRNYYLASLSQCPQLLYLGSIIQRIAFATLSGSALTITSLASSMIPWIYAPFIFFAASVKSHDYNNFVEFIDKKKPSLAWLFPKELKPLTINFLKFSIDHNGAIIRAAMIISSIAIFYLGHYIYGATLLTTLAYGEIRELGWIPKSIDLFLESKLQAISNIALFVGTGGFLRFISTIQLLCYFPKINRFILGKVSSLITMIINSFVSTGTSFNEFFKPLEKRKPLSLEEICEILKAKNEDFEVDPRACSISAAADSPSSEKVDFHDLYKITHEFFDLTNDFSAICNKLKNDEAFFFSIVDEKKFSQDQIAEHKKLLYDKKIAELIEKAFACSPQEHLKKVVLLQMQALIDRLTNKNYPEGTAVDIDAATSNFREIIPYLREKLGQLKELNSESPEFRYKKVELEDFLLAIAIEGGAYCPRALKDVSESIKNDLFLHPTGDEGYERAILQSLENERKRLTSLGYASLSSWLPSVLSLDRHLKDLYKSLSIGFCPISKHEEANMTSEDVFLWTTYSKHRNQMMQDYFKNLDEVLRSLDSSIVENALKKQLMHLEDSTQERLIHEYKSAQTLFKEAEQKKITRWERAKDLSPKDAEKEREAASNEALNSSNPFHRLLFVSLGVLRWKKGDRKPLQVNP